MNRGLTTVSVTERAGSNAVTTVAHVVRHSSRIAYGVTIIGLSTLSLALGFAALFLTPAGTSAAIWWPAAGVSVLLYLFYRGPAWQVLAIVAAVAALSNVLIGRPPVFAVVGMVILVVEVIVFGLIMGRRANVAPLTTTRGLVRFALAALVAALSVGVLGSISLAFIAGAAPIATFLSLVPSHLSALVVIVPIALVPLVPVGRRRWVEMSIQTTLTAALTVVIFAPWQTEPIGSALLPLIGWAAVRFSPLYVITQLIWVATLSSVLTAYGNGLYVVAGLQGLSASALLQVYVLSIAITALFLAVTNAEATAMRTSIARNAAILRGGFVGSQVGAVFARIVDGDTIEIIEKNDVANRVHDDEWLEPFIHNWVLSGTSEQTSHVTTTGGRTLQVSATSISADDDEHLLGVQFVDVTDFVIAEQAAAKAAEDERAIAEGLRELGEQKEQFLATVSHELRTPITNIIGFADELDETANDEQRASLAIILRNALRLSDMVEQLLIVNDAGSRGASRAGGAVDVNSVAERVAEEHAATARGRDVTVTTILSSEPAWIAGDTDSVERIVINLVTNAVKFAPAGGHVAVTVDADRNDVRIIVDDDGPGISDEDSPRVFDRFFRSADAHKRQTPGTGLGLSITKTLTESLGGTVELETAPLGGARFVVTLPRAQAPVTL